MIVSIMSSYRLSLHQSDLEKTRNLVNFKIFVVEQGDVLVGQTEIWNSKSYHIHLSAKHEQFT